MDASFYDDSSAALGLSHGRSGETDEERAERLRQKIESERNEYRKSILDAGLVDWLIAYLKADPETRELQPSDMEQLAIDRYLSIRGGAHERVRTYVEVRHMDLRAAIMKAESDISHADEIEAHAEGADEMLEPEDLRPDEPGEWSERKIEALMKAPVEPHGGGSKSKSYKSRRIPDAPVVEQALRKGMVA